MDMATVVGFFGALALIGWAMQNGGSLLAYLDPSSLLIVFGGTAATVLARYRWQDFVAHLKAALVIFKSAYRDPTPLAAMMSEWARQVRDNGQLSLEANAAVTEDPFLRHGLQLLADGADAERLAEQLKINSDHQVAHHMQMINMWQSWVDVAPAMGMIGTLVGLVQMLGNMSDPRAIGPAMALALLTTLYGAVLAFVIAGPIMQKLIQFAKEDEHYHQTVVSGFCMIAKGEGPVKVMTAMTALLPATPSSAIPNPVDKTSASERKAP
jgi:chemotaxis protein MotA